MIDAVIKKAQEENFDSNIEVTIAKENQNSYGAFKKYCINNNYDLSPIGLAKVKDVDNPDFYEEEIKYMLKKNI